LTLQPSAAFGLDLFSLGLFGLGSSAFLAAFLAAGLSAGFSMPAAA
jgi:hypothetical protein